MSTQDDPRRKSPEDTTRIFVSYSHADIRWAIRGEDPGHEGLRYTLIPWLQEQLRNDRVEIWCDPKLKDAPHEDFAERIQKEIALADIALPLLSEEFANSEFIQREELPPIKERQANRDLAVLSILVGPITKQARQKIGWLFRPTVLPSDVKPLLNFLSDEAEFRAKRIEILEAIRNTIEYIQAERLKPVQPEVTGLPTTPLGTDAPTNRTESDSVLAVQEVPIPPDLRSIVSSARIQQEGYGYVDNRAQVFGELMMKAGDEDATVFAWLESLVGDPEHSIADNAALVLLKQQQHPSAHTIERLMTLLRTATNAVVRRFVAADFANTWLGNAATWGAEVKAMVFRGLKYTSTHDDQNLARWAAMETLTTIGTAEAIEHVAHIVLSKQRGADSNPDDWVQAITYLTKSKSPLAGAALARICRECRDSDVLASTAYWLKCNFRPSASFSPDDREAIMHCMMALVTNTKIDEQGRSSAFALLIRLDPHRALSVVVASLETPCEGFDSLLVHGLREAQSNRDEFLRLLTQSSIAGIFRTRMESLARKSETPRDVAVSALELSKWVAV